MDLDIGVSATRSYQQEMFERSMEGNRIIVMDTGSGKTRVSVTSHVAYLANRDAYWSISAILRIQAELDRCPPHKRVWFLAPTVELCIQQHRELEAALPAYSHRLLTGSDNVDFWSVPRIWEAALDKHRVVVSTHAVLADALRHGFLSIVDISLIVFDEAHHCGKKHPANVIMQEFYHPTRIVKGPTSVPHILGLSASLVIKPSLASMKVIENNLDAISVTPRIHRETLMLHVHRPDCQLLEYNECTKSSSKAVKRLSELRVRFENSVSVQPGTDDSERTRLSTTYSNLRAFCRKAEAIEKSLGSWAAEFFIHRTIETLQESCGLSKMVYDVEEGCSRELLTLLTDQDIKETCRPQIDPADESVSHKVKTLISFLTAQRSKKSAGIIFLEQRVTTSVLVALLRRHSSTGELFRCVPFVGASNHSSRKYRLTELLDIKSQKGILEQFRAGDHDLVIATNALEEGIDIQSCNTVICFDPPKNLKSFIQRRGRARHIRSRLAVLISTTDDPGMVGRWQSLEDELQQICQEERSQVSHLRALENQNEPVDLVLIASSTSARLNADATLQHIHHFCNQLPHRPYVDYSPQFSYKEDSTGMIEATVFLPNCVPYNVRRATSQKLWRSERAAKKDAAHHAYRKLYEAGLLNENLLPLNYRDVPINDPTCNKDVPNVYKVSPQMNIWSKMLREERQMHWYETIITIAPPPCLQDRGEQDLKLRLMSLGPLEPLSSLLLQWAPGITFTVRYENTGSSKRLEEPLKEALRDSTKLIYFSMRSTRLVHCDKNFATLLMPLIGFDQLTEWVRESSRSFKARDALEKGIVNVIRAPFPNKPAYLFCGWSALGSGDLIHCERVPRRRNFRASALTGSGAENTGTPSHIDTSRKEYFHVDACSIDNMPLSLARTGLLLPAIFQHAEDYMTGYELRRTLLEHIEILDIRHVVTAICAPSAGRPDNYERFEFLGDIVLKFVVSYSLFAAEPNYHEGHLTLRRSHLVCNATLAQAAISAGLPRFIITKHITPKDWTVPIIELAQGQNKHQEHREMSTKLIADVVEALICAAWMSSGLKAAVASINAFLPAIPIQLPCLSGTETADQQNFKFACDIESLVGYKFQDRGLLLEALTHPSCGGYATTDSYQRLEFLGDAVLDMLVGGHLKTQAQRLSAGRMTQIKAALVNARLLGFLCLDLRISKACRDIYTDDSGGLRETTNLQERHMADFMRFDSRQMAAARLSSEERYRSSRDYIRNELSSGEHYPWIYLSHLSPDKFYSDIVESVFGAILVDSEGDLESCQTFFQRLGLQVYMDRLIDEAIDTRHPRERVQQIARSGKVSYGVKQDDADGKFRCSCVIDGTTIIEVGGCQDREEAILQAASEAEEVLKTPSDVLAV